MSNSDSMHFEKIYVTPELASSWLERHNFQRDVRQTKVDRFIHLLKSGQFKLTHQGVAFAPDGSGLDGQHRLWAIVTSGVAAWMWVCYGAPKDTASSIDAGGDRSMADRVLFEVGRRVTNQELAVARVIVFGPTFGAGGGSRFRGFASAVDAASAIQKHADAVTFAIGVLGQRRSVTTAIERAVIARAYYSRDRERLSRFGMMLSSGKSDGNPESEIVIILREKLLTAASREAPPIRYGKVERTLEAFCNGEVISRLYCAKHELFPLPEESAAASQNPDPQIPVGVTSSFPLRAAK